MLSIAGFEPAELGLPEKFTEFREAQIEAIEFLSNTDKRFALADLPTGSGKTLIAIAAAKVLGMRTAIITSTLGLQEQYLKDFAEIGLVDIRGKANYDCNSTAETCKHGGHAGCPHTAAAPSPEGDDTNISTPLCVYGGARAVATSSDLVITNYAYWIRSDGANTLCKKDKLTGGPKNPIELLILDEAHRASEELSRTLQIQLTEILLRKSKLDFKRSDDIRVWQAWVSRNKFDIDQDYKLARLAYRTKPTKEHRKDFFDYERLKEFCDKIQNVNPDSWVCEAREGGHMGRMWTFDPVWPANYNSKLFGDIPKVILMSATLRPIAARMLGIEKDEYEFKDWPRCFPANRTPVLHVPTARMNHKAKEEDFKKWVERIDEIIDTRLDRKGLIHTVSYARQQYLLDKSRHKGRMVCNTSEPDSPSATEVFDRFREMDSPAILVSPSFSTGWDFPGDNCRYQIIAKLPFPDSRNKLMQARLERNPQYINSLCMQDLQQAAGRGTRSYEDWCEVFIVDDSIGWFMKQNAGLASRWFKVDTASKVTTPPPMEVLTNPLK